MFLILKIFIFPLILLLQFLRFCFSKIIVRKKLFYPKSHIVWTPTVNICEKEKLVINSTSSIMVWKFFPKEYLDKNIVIIYPGNIENMSFNKDLYELGYNMGLNVVMFDYRGYGLSIGEPSINNVLEDGITVYKYIREQYPDKKIILWGDSMGCSIVSHTAKTIPKLNLKPPHKLLLMGSFSSVSDVLYEKKGSFIGFIGKILFILFDCDLHVEKWLQDINYKIDIIYLHSYYDKDISITNCFKNMDCNNEFINSKFLKITGSHCNPIISNEVVEILKEEMK